MNEEQNPNELENEAEIADSENGNGSASEEKKQSVFGTVFDTVETLVLYFSIAITIILLLFTHSPVSGSSMVPTLDSGDLLIVRRFAYTPENGDIIVCQSEKYGLEKPLVKRVIAKEGQTVKIDYKNWTVTVDGKQLTEDYINRSEFADMVSSNYLPDEFTVPPNSLFVMGDNRNVSYDSRSDKVGFIDERYVIGKVTVRIFPITEFEIF